MSKFMVVTTAVGLNTEVGSGEGTPDQSEYVEGRRTVGTHRVSTGVKLCRV